jgi:hypothetical protein
VRRLPTWIRSDKSVVRRFRRCAKVTECTFTNIDSLCLHNEELNGLYSLPNIMRVIKSRRLRWAGHVARMGEGRGVYRVLVRKPEGKRPLGRTRHRWEDNTRMDLQEVGCGYED